jgi:hypothetical protein
MSEYQLQPGDRIVLPPTMPGAPCPFEIRPWLEGRGWTNQFGDRWYMYAKHRESFTWEQAVACEFYEFISLGGR